MRKRQKKKPTNKLSVQTEKNVTRLKDHEGAHLARRQISIHHVESYVLNKQKERETEKSTRVDPPPPPSLKGAKTHR